jgi:phosphotransferase system HPr (HPr) family protein
MKNPRVKTLKGRWDMMKGESVVKKLVFQHKKGLHARVAAMIVQKTYELQKKYNSMLYLQYKNSEKIPLSSLLILTSLKVKAGEVISIIACGESSEEAAEEMARYLESDFVIVDNPSINKVDTLLQDNVSTAEQIFNSMANGLIVIDENDIITFFNPVAEKIFKLQSKNVIGKNVSEIIPGTGLEKVSRNKHAEIGAKQSVGGSMIVKSSTPIIVDGESKGAVCIFEDISKYVKVSWQLKEIRELKEKYQLILESMQEGICVLDNDGTIIYVNPAYLKILGQDQNALIGKKIEDVSPEGARNKVLKTGKTILGNISKKKDNITIIANVNPIIVDGEILGVVSVVNDITEIQSLVEKLNKASAKAEYLEYELSRTKKYESAFQKIIGTGGKINDAIAIAAKAAEGIYTVLIRGESGTGKELFAEAIHFSSKRASKPFIRVNCAAIPSTLLESELFGHEKGAFTGAIKTKLGKFELANKGTIFLDEIGDMENSMQAKLLRVLQKKEFQRVGGEETIHVDVRIIAATNRNLEELMMNGYFREDLYYRLNVIPIILPPLRERKEDIPALIEFYVKKINSELGKEIIGVKEDAMEAILRYSWPGNIRELENILERTITLLDGEYIRIIDLPNYIRDKIVISETKINPSILDDDNIILKWSDYEKTIVKAALKKYGSYNAAGKALGLTHKTIASKAQKYGIVKIIAWDKVPIEEKSINTNNEV